MEEEPFWARGHIPGRPLMPGVIMIEAAAQLCSWAVRQVYDTSEYGDRFFGFGGIDDVKFRGTVFPGQQMIILGVKNEVRPRRAVFDTQGWVDGRMVFQAKITGHVGLAGGQASTRPSHASVVNSAARLT